MSRLRPLLAGLTISVLVAAGFVVGAGTANAFTPRADATQSASTPADASESDTEADASAIAVEYGHSVIVDSETSPTQEVTALPDGTMKAEMDVVPTRVRQNSAWVDENTELSVGTSGWATPTAAAEPVRFSTGGSTAMAQVQSSNGNWISESWPYGNLPTPTVTGSSAVYANVFPGVDLRLTATAPGMSEVLVVKTADAAADPQLADVDLRISGATVATQSATRALTATTTAGSSVVSAAPMWWDSSASGANWAGAGAGEPQSSTYATSGSNISLNVDSITSNPGLTYPLFVDPDWNSDMTADWYDDQAYPTQSYLDPSSDSLGNGVEDGVDYLSRMFMQFTTGFMAGKLIQSAHLNLTQTYANSCDTTPVQLWEYVPGTPGFTWNTDQATPASWNTLIDSEVNISGGPCAAAGAVGFNATAAVQVAASRSASSIELGLRIPAASEGNTQTRKHYNWAGALIVTYDTRPNVPTATAFTVPARTCSTVATSPIYLNSGQTPGITVAATFTDPDAATGGSGATVKGDWQLLNGSSLAVITSVVTPNTSLQTSGTTQSWVIPASLLTNGTEYSWVARADDGTLQSAATAPCYFTVMNNAPPNPTVVASGSTIATGGGSTGSTLVVSGATVGVGSTVEVTDSGSTPVAEYGYFIKPTAVPGTLPPPPVTGTSGSTPPIVALPPCGAIVSGEHFVCQTAGATSTILSIAPTDALNSTVFIATYDAAGNSSVATTAVEFLGSHESPDVVAGSGHQWVTSAWTTGATQVAAGATTVPDLSGGSSLSVAGGTVAADLPSPGGDPDGVAFTFTGAAGTTTSGVHSTGTAPVNTSNSFSVGAWMLLNSASTGSYTALSEAGTGSPGFTLNFVPSGSSGSHVAQFCLNPTPSSATPAPICVLQTGTGELDGQWAYVTGVWDKANNEMRLYVGGIDTSTGTAAVPSAVTSATGNFVVGAAGSGTSYTQQWNGQIADPVVFPGVVDNAALGDMSGESSWP